MRVLFMFLLLVKPLAALDKDYDPVATTTLACLLKSNILSQVAFHSRVDDLNSLKELQVSVQNCLDRNADPNQVSPDSTGVLHLAVALDDADWLEMLLHMPISLDMHLYDSPFYLAIKLDRTKMLTRLLRTSEAKNFIEKNRESLLRSSGQIRTPEFLDLIFKDLDPLSLAPYQGSFLSAIYHKNYTALSAYIKNGVPIFFPDTEKVWEAVVPRRSNHNAMIFFLLERGMPFSVLKEMDMTQYIYSKLFEWVSDCYFELIKILRQDMQKYNGKIKKPHQAKFDLLSPLTCALLMRNDEKARELLKQQHRPLMGPFNDLLLAHMIPEWQNVPTGTSKQKEKLWRNEYSLKDLIDARAISYHFIFFNHAIAEHKLSRDLIYFIAIIYADFFLEI